MKSPIWDVMPGRITPERVRSWTGRIIRYEHHWGSVAVPVETISDGATVDDIIETAKRMVASSEDDHHCFIEDIAESPDGVFLDIFTGS